MNGSVTYEGSTLLSGAINVNAGGNIEALNVQVTENGTRKIESSSGVDGYSPITIETNVPIPEPELDSITITENGTYTPPTGTDGYNEISVDVPAPILISKTITENGTYTPPTGTDGYNEISVNVQQQTNFILQNKNIIENNMYTTHDFTDQLTVGKQYIVVYSGLAIDNYPIFIGAFVKTSANNLITLDVGHGIQAQLTISLTQSKTTYANDSSASQIKYNFLEMPSSFADGLVS